MRCNHVESGGDKVVESFEVVPQTNDRRFDFGHRSNAERRTFQGGEQLLEARHLDPHGSRDIGVLSLAGRGKHGRRGGGDPFGLAGKLEGCKRGWHPPFRDTLDDVPDLKESVEGGDGREHREGADAEESEQQTAANAETLKHAGNVSDRLIGPNGLRRSVSCHSSGTYSPPFQTYHIQL